MSKPNMNIPEMKEKAQEILEEQDYFILAYDIINSKKWNGEDRRRLQEIHHELHSRINKKFADVLSKYEYSYTESRKGIHFTGGDAGVMGLLSAESITEIVKTAQEQSPAEMRWCVGEETSSPEILSLIK